MNIEEGIIMDALKEIKIACAEIKTAFLEVLIHSQGVLDEIKVAIDSDDSEENKAELAALHAIQTQISDFHHAISQAESLFTEEEKNLEPTNPDKMLKQMNDLLAKMVLSCSEAHFAILSPETIEPDEDDVIGESSVYLLITLKKKQMLLAGLPMIEKANRDIYAIYIAAKTLLEPYTQKRMLELVKDQPGPINETELQGYIESLLSSLEKVKKIYDEIREYAEVQEQKITQNFISMERRMGDISASILPLLQTLSVLWINQLGSRELLERHIAFIKNSLKKLGLDEAESEHSIFCIKENIVKLEKELAKLPEIKSVSSYYDYLYVPDFFRIPWLSTIVSALPATESAPAAPPQGLGQKV